jgi:hypothetical protein
VNGSIVLSCRKISWQWEAVELSNIDVCPMYGPFEQRHNGPTVEFFQILNCIQYVRMPHSNGLYSLLDTPEPKLSDLFGSTTSDSSIALVVEGVARARMDDDSTLGLSVKSSLYVVGDR